MAKSKNTDRRPHSRSVGPKRWVGDGVCCAAILGVCLALGLPRYRIDLDLRDEGFLACGAVRVMEGQIPNRDFVSLQPPLSFYVLAAAFKVLGTSLASLRTLGLCLYTSIPILLFAIARRRADRATSLAAAAPALVLGMPFFNFVPFAVWHGVAASLTAVLFLIRAVDAGSPRWALAAGLATSATILFRHDQGLYLTLSVVVYGLVLGIAGKQGTAERPKGVLRFWAMGTAAPLVVLAGYWLASGAIPSMFQQLVVSLLTTYGKTSSLPIPSFGSDLFGRRSLLVAMFYGVPIVDGLVGVWLSSLVLRRRFTVDHAHQSFLLVLSVLFYCQALTRSDFEHLLITLGPFFVVLAWTAAEVSRKLGESVGRRRRGWPLSWATAPALFALFAAAGACFLLYMRPAMLGSTDRPLRGLALERAGVRVDPQTAQSLESVVGMIQRYAEPGRAILCLPYCPMFYFLTERRNPTRWNYLWPGDQTAEDHRALIEAAKKDPPAVVALIGEDEMEGYAKTVIDHVRSGFRLKEDLGALKIYLPAETNSR